MRSEELFYSMEFLLFLSCLVMLCSSRAQQPVVRTTSGLIKGFDNNNSISWLGIPYAEKPIGILRYERPVSISQPAQNILNAFVQPDACIQIPDETFGNFSGSQLWNPKTNTSEDCLYLNIHVPKPYNSNRSLPVLVWIYGGGYSTGTATLPIYNPKEYVEKGNIIFVGIQYRLGATGFLYTGEKGSGNMGLYDQVAALKWVHDNIRNFGGDPNQVTLMGESAGANSIAIHMTSHISQHYFQRCILQSAGLKTYWGLTPTEVAKKRAFALAELMGCDSKEEIKHCLRKLKAKYIAEKEYAAVNYTINLFPFGPVVDGEIIKSDPKVLMENILAGDQSILKNKTSILIGSNSNEGFWSLMYFMTDVYPNKELTEEQKILSERQFESAVGQIFPTYSKEIQGKISKQYPSTGKRTFFFNALDQIVADSAFVCSTEEFAEANSKIGNDVYRYVYDHISSSNPWPTWSGVKHGDELEFSFGGPLRESRKYSSKEVRLSNEMVNYWLNFVKFGNPNSNNVVFWPKYEKENRWSYLKLNTNTSVCYLDMNKRCIFWNKILPNELKS